MTYYDTNVVHITIVKKSIWDLFEDVDFDNTKGGS